MTEPTLTPRPGHVVQVSTLPACDFCQAVGIDTRAAYDFRTYFGSWANGCESHYEQFRAHPETGVGHGQRLITA